MAQPYRGAPTNRQILELWATTRQAPLWVCIALYVMANVDEAGRLSLKRGALRAAVDPVATPAQIWTAVRRAVAAGWLLEGSTSTDLRVK